MRKLYKRLLYKLTLFLMFCISNVSAQEIEWQNTIGGSDLDDLEKIIQTIDGGYILAGTTRSGVSGDITGSNLGGDDYLLVKIDAKGSIMWQRKFGGTNDDVLYSMHQTSDGGFILGGSSESNISGNKTENSMGSMDYWIVKTDSVGNIQWQNTIGGSSLDLLTDIEQTSDNGYILGGFSNSDISGDKSENSLDPNNAYRDYWIIKTDSIGNILWQNTIGGNGEEVLWEIQQTTDGGYFLGGYSSSYVSGDKSENPLGLTDAWIVKTDSIGNIIWENTIGGTNDDRLLSAHQTSDGGYILGLTSESSISGDKSEICYGSSDFWIIKTDPLGIIQWQNTIGGNSMEGNISIKQNAEGGYLVAGFSWSGISGDKNEMNTYIDYWLLELNFSGEILWQNTISGSYYDELKCIQNTLDGEYIGGGNSNSNSSLDKIENCIGNYDYWIVKLTSNYNHITGMMYVDANSNGSYDTGEFFMPSRKIVEQTTGRFTFTDQTGKYSLSVLDSGSFTVVPPSIIWYSPQPSSHSVSFSGLLQTDSLNDFAIQPQGTFEDVCVTITPLGNFRSGFPASYMINYGNYGNTIVAPTVYFYPYSNVTYHSATLTPNYITPDSVVWNIPALTPFQTGSIIVYVTVDLGLTNGTLINSSAHIEPYLTDDNPSCNNSNWEVYTTGSFDPNDILVNRSDFTTTELSASPWLEYIIRFQNTGNDTAFTVKILNPIDTNKLNLSSIEFVNASHPVNLNWINYQRNMEFKFENILLVDSNTNEPLSHGFVHYRIQPKTNLSAGDTITNFAAIYFDFNEPVITNTAKTIIVLPTGLSSSSPTRGKLHVFPNPTENTLNISGIQLENGKAQLRLMDIYGKLILDKTITSITTTLETNKLSSGIYLIQLGELRATFVKQ